MKFCSITRVISSFIYFYSVHFCQPYCRIVRFGAHIRCGCLINTPLHYTTRECIAGSMRGCTSIRCRCLINTPLHYTTGERVAGSMRGRTSILSRVRVAVLGRSPGRPVAGCWLSPDPSSTVVRPCDVRLSNAVHRHISSVFSIKSHTWLVMYDFIMGFFYGL